MNFVCPKCTSPLEVSVDGAARCERGHSFDRARAGYYNLLLTSVGGTHGDNAEMVAARRDFLNTGAYLPLAQRVAALAFEHTDGGVCLDMGCGEGYYTDIIEKSLSKKGVEVVGFDISKDAVARAAKRNRSIEFAVASAYKVPMADSSVATAVNMFSPLALDEVRRVLKRGGVYIMAIPAENHLFGLKAAIYDTPYKNEPQSTELEGFELLSEERLTYPLFLDSSEKIKSLFMMTPYAYRTSRVGRERISALSSLECEADFMILLYRRL